MDQALYDWASDHPGAVIALLIFITLGGPSLIGRLRAMRDAWTGGLRALPDQSGQLLLPPPPPPGSAPTLSQLYEAMGRFDARLARAEADIAAHARAAADERRRLRDTASNAASTAAAAAAACERLDRKVDDVEDSLAELRGAFGATPTAGATEHPRP